MMRLARFSAVGLAGVGVQLLVLKLLHSGLGVNYLAATGLAVETAVLHNFVWHWKWTWRERQSPAMSLVRFQFTNGLLSLVGNLAFMKLYAGVMGLPVLAANLLSIASLYALNFLAADRFVFRLR